MDDDDAEALDCLLEFMYTMKPPTTIAERRPGSDDFVAWKQLLTKTYQLADKYHQPLLLEIVFDKVMHLFAHGIKPALIKSISLLQSMGESENIFKLEDYLMQELARLDLGDLCDGTKEVLENNPQVSYGLIETLSAITQELESSLDIHETLHRLQAEDSMQPIDRCTCRRVDDGMHA